MSLLKNISFRPLFFAAIILLFNSCVEELELDSENFESILIVEGIITDEVKFQEVKISRSYRLDENGPSPVSNAEVVVRSSNGENIPFSETSPGVYISGIDFAARPGIEYTLEVSTANGVYESTTISGQESTQIDEVRTIKTNYRQDEGVAILVSSSDQNEGRFYKYEYEETYKIVSPYKKLWDLVVVGEDSLKVVDKTREEYICYNTLPSTEIILSGANELSENNIDDYLVKFIERDNFKMSYRYSMLVKQLRISADAHAFYETLKNLSEAENIFSQYQPGLLSGNIQPIDDNAEKVVGIFSAAAVDEARVFFSYIDYFDPEVYERASHINDCEPFTDNYEVLIELLEEGTVKFFTQEPPVPPTYFVVSAPCVDCNYFGTNVKPEFWID